MRKSGCGGGGGGGGRIMTTRETGREYINWPCPLMIHGSKYIELIRVLIFVQGCVVHSTTHAHTHTYTYSSLKIIPKMVPAKMSVTKELVPDILY